MLRLLKVPPSYTSVASCVAQPSRRLQCVKSQPLYQLNSPSAFVLCCVSTRIRSESNSVAVARLRKSVEHEKSEPCWLAITWPTACVRLGCLPGNCVFLVKRWISLLQLGLRICLAPYFPRIAGSFGFGLRSRPFFLVKKPSIPLLPLLLSRAITPSSASAGNVKFCSARADQLFSLSSICPLLLLLEVRGGAFGLCGGSGRLKDVVVPI